MPTIHVAHSPDSDDAFMFWALAAGRIDTGDREYVHELADIETLNRRALDAELEVTAVSVHAYAHLSDTYAILPHGASMGDREYGPRLVARSPKPDDVRAAIARDLGDCAGSVVDVRLTSAADTGRRHTEPLPGDSLDDNDVDCDAWHVDADLLRADPDKVVNETLHSDLLRSLCPVTGQPDSGSVLIRYRGPRIERAALTRYIVSYRQHSDFHENCVERMFVDLLDRCAPQALTVYARFQRRGGIDINPFRSNFEQDPPNSRLWRQ